MILSGIRKAIGLPSIFTGNIARVARIANAHKKRKPNNHFVANGFHLERAIVE